MAVAEVTVSHAAGGDATPAARGVRLSLSAKALLALTRDFARTAVARAVLLLMVLPQVQIARAQVVADPKAAGSLRPQILSTANGTPQVNIQTPSAAGVSRNVYSQFDIDRRGAILNNATAATQTQIGGWVQANGNLNGGSARVILNEVNTTAASQLRGFVEVAGQRAEVVIANPAGIAVNGGGFINASAVTLTTGTPVLNSGNLEGYRVTGGTIQIDGSGLDASGADYARILARAIKINAGLWAQDLKVVAGAHQSNTDASAITPGAPDAGTAPRYALDVATLGGMYAGKIVLIGTEAGLGVNNTGVIAANSELVLRTDGLLVNRGVLDAQTTRVEAGDLQNIGTGRLYGDHVALQARRLINAPETIEGTTSAPVIAARDRLDIAAGSLVNGLGAAILSGGDLVIGGQLDTDLRASGSAQTLLNAGGTIEAQRNLYASADRIQNTNPGFAYEIRSDGSFNGKEYITASGVYTSNQVAWILAENTYGWAGPGGGYRYSGGQGRLLPTGHAYADPKYQPYYNSAQAYIAAHTTYTSDFDGNVYPVQVPDSFAYTASDAIWGVLGVAPPSGPAPGPRPTPSCNDFGCYTPSAAELNAWQTAAAPWVALQSRLDTFRAAVDASAITFTSFRNYSQDIPVAVVTASTPGRVLSGGDMRLHAGTELLNSQSHILAGGTLAVTGTSLNNQGLEIAAQALRSGRAYAWSNFNYGCGNIKGCDYNYDAYRESDYSIYIPKTLSLNQASSRSGDATAVALGSLPASSLFHAAGNPHAGYVIETDPLFTSYRAWLSSDYMLSALALDPELTQKRLGDGYFEQRLVREQVAQLTGRRFLDDYSSDEQQYLALMNAGVAYAQAHALRPGLTLSADQMAALTQDMVWLIEQTVTLPDGTTTSALIPRLYTVARSEDLDGTGALLSARSLDIQLDGQFSSSGRIAALRNADISAHDIRLASSGAADLQANRVTLQAVQDINLSGSRIEAGVGMDLQAGRDLQLTTTTSSGTSADGQHRLTQIDRAASLATRRAEDTLRATAGRTLSLTAAAVDAAGSVSLQAGENIVLDTVQTAASHHILGGNASHSDDRQTDVGSQLTAAGDMHLQAGTNLRATAVQLQAGAQLQADTGRDLIIQSGSNSYRYSHSLEVSTSSLLSSRVTRTEIDSEHGRAVASSVEGQTIRLQSKRDTTLRGSNVLAEQDLSLQSGGHVSIEAAQETSTYRAVTTTHESGLLSGGGLGVSIGSREQQLAQGTRGTTAMASTVGSVTGDLQIQADQAYTQTGSNVLTSQGSIDISAKTVRIQEAREQTINRLDQQFRQSGLTLSLGGGIIDTLQATTQAVQGAVNGSSTRNKALNALIAYGRGSDLIDQGRAIGPAAQQDGVQGSEGKSAAAAASGIKVSISLGSSSSQYHSNTISETAAGSTVKAGENVIVRATGLGQGEGDLTIQGSTLQAGRDTTLQAANTINIAASADTEKNRSNNASSSTSIGLSFGIGKGSAGLSVDVAVSRGKGQANSDSVTYNNSHVIAGNQMTVTSGADTNIKGGTVAGSQVIVSARGNLNIESLQDRADSAAEQSTTGIALSIPLTGAGGSASMSQVKQTSNSNYASVHEQSGIHAGDGGFAINVHGSTDLKGAVISSTDRAIQDGKNSLATTTLTTNEISNSMRATASASGTNVGTDMLSGKYELGKALAGNALNNGSADLDGANVTTSAISAALVTVGSKTTDTRKEVLLDSSGKTVSSDTSNTHRALAKADMPGLQRQAQKNQADNMLTYQAATALTDPAFRQMFLREAKMYAIVKHEDGSIALNSNGAPRFRELSTDEKSNLQPGPDGKIHIANNGIFNGTEFDPSAAAKYAAQNNGAAYFIHFPEASNAVSELLIAAYQKHLEGDTLGLTNATREVKDAMTQYGQSGLQLDGHSRGSMTVGNAMESLARETGANGSLGNTSINFFGPAYNAQKADELLAWLQNRGGMTSEEKGRAILMFQNHIADPVGGLPLVGNNPGTGGTVPPGSSALVEKVRAVAGQKITVHNCYGAGDPDGACQKFWRDTGGSPVSQPARPELLNRENN